MSKNLFSCVKFLEKNTEKPFEEFASNWLVRFFINQTKINKHNTTTWLKKKKKSPIKIRVNCSTVHEKNSKKNWIGTTSRIHLVILVALSLIISKVASILDSLWTQMTLLPHIWSARLHLRRNVKINRNYWKGGDRNILHLF